MIVTTELTKLFQFEQLRKGQIVAVEFKRDVSDYPKKIRFGVFPIYQNKSDTKEIILQRKNNIYFNYEMFLNGESNLKSIILISSDNCT